MTRNCALLRHDLHIQHITYMHANRADGELELHLGMGRTHGIAGRLGLYTSDPYGR
jgi:hypothetical protein